MCRRLCTCLQLLRRQYMYFRTRKARKLSPPGAQQGHAEYVPPPVHLHEREHSSHAYAYAQTRQPHAQQVKTLFFVP